MKNRIPIKFIIQQRGEFEKANTRKKYYKKKMPLKQRKGQEFFFFFVYYLYFFCPLVQKFPKFISSMKIANGKNEIK